MGGDVPSEATNLSPVLDMLDQMEDQVGNIAHHRPHETSASSAADEELNRLREELLAADRRGYEQLAAFTQALDDLKVAIPGMIEETVSHRLLEIEDSFHRHIKEIHSRSIDSFTQTVQSKIGQRIATLENNLAIHTEAMGQLREHYLKTDRNVQRLMTGLDRLTAELLRLSAGAGGSVPRSIFTPGSTRMERAERSERSERSENLYFRPLPPASQPAGFQSEEPPASNDDSRREYQQSRARKRKVRRRSVWVVPLLALVILVPLGLVGWAIAHNGAAFGSVRNKATAMAEEKPVTGIAAQMKMAQDFTVEKDYVKAESTYRLILKSEPTNRDAIRELASVLFRQQRYDEAAAVLKTLPPE